MKRNGSLLLVLVLLHTPATAWAEQKPSRLPVQDQDIDRLLRTDYYGLYLMGKKIGWVKTSLTRLNAKIPGYVSHLEGSFKLTALGSKTELRMLETEEFDAKPPYAFRGGLARETDGKSVKETKLTPTTKGFDVVIRTGDGLVRKQLSAIDYTLEDLATVYLWIRQGAKQGDMITIRNFDFDELKIDREVYKLTATKIAVAEGVKITYHEMEITAPRQGITSLARFDQKGEQLLSMRLAGRFEMRVEPEKLAKKTQFSGDLFELGKVKVDKRLGAGTTIASLVLEATGGQDLNLKPGPRQSVIQNQSGTYTLKLGKAHGVPTKATPQEIEDHLAETVTYPISHAKIQALAREAVGDARTADEKVKRVVRFVSRYITPSYTARPLTVMDVVKIRKGACSEYALLFTTLARAAGIPAREVGGLVYMGDDDKAFGFHAWSEVVLDGRWVPVDASCNETEINPTHISFGSVLGDQATNILCAASSKLSFRVVEVKYRK
jgi:protein-glutamine gamma-glutamyltransferase